MKETPLIEWVKNGIEVVGSGVAPILSTMLGEAPGGMLTQFGVLLGHRITDYIQRSNSEIESRRSAGAVVVAGNLVQAHINEGGEFRGDDFFRIKTGSQTSADILIDGVLTKAKSQYEERKINLMGAILANGVFDKYLSADDLSWMIESVSSQTYRQLLILAHFCNIETSPWNTENIRQIYNRNPIGYTEVKTLISLGLLMENQGLGVQIVISPSGRLLVGATNLLVELQHYGDDIKDMLAEPEKGFMGL